MKDLEIPLFGVLQDKEGNWRVMYKWWHPTHGFFADTLIVPEKDRERLIPQAMVQLRQLFKELQETLGG
jgi:hypothetical protein